MAVGGGGGWAGGGACVCARARARIFHGGLTPHIHPNPYFGSEGPMDTLPAICRSRDLDMIGNPLSVVH